MRQIWISALVVSAVSLSLPAEAAPFFTALPDLGGSSPASIGFYSSADDVSADGSVVVGYARNADDDPEAFAWTLSGGLVGLGPTRAFGTSNDGSVVVGFSRHGPSSTEAFRWTQAGGLVGIGTLSGDTQSFAWDLSHNGDVVVGESGPDEQAFRWTQAEGMQSIGPGAAFAISDDGLTIVGTNGTAFRWTESEGMISLGDLLGGAGNPLGDSNSSAQDVSADGSVIVGWGVSGLVGTEAFRWTQASGLVGLGFLLGGDQSNAQAVSADGSVVGGQSWTSEGYQAFLWDEESGMRNVRTILEDLGLDLTGWRLDSLNGISADGLTLAGTGTNPFGKNQGWVAFVPEPPVALLVASGLLFFSRRTIRVG